MPRKKKQPPQEERWLTAREATALLRTNSGRDDISESYIRSLVRSGKVTVKELDGRTKLYRHSDVESYKVERRDQGKRQTRAARVAGEPRFAPTPMVQADTLDTSRPDTDDEKRKG